MGLKWAKANSSRLADLDSTGTNRESRAGSVDTARRLRELARVQSTTAWKKWIANDGPISVQDAREVFRIDSYAQSEMLRLKTNRLMNLLIDDENMDRFLSEMRNLLEPEDTP